MPIINVPGFGNVEFPDSMNDAQIADAIKENMPKSSNASSALQQQMPQAKMQPGFELNGIPEALVNLILGAGDATQNLLASTGNLIPGVNIPKAKSSEGGFYQTGRILGDIGSFLGGAAPLKAGLKAAEAAPYIGQAAKYLGGEGLGGILRRAGGMEAFSQLQNPEGFTGQGAIPSVAMDLVMKGIRPLKYAKQLGLQVIPQAAKEEKSISKGLYDQAFKEAGEASIFPGWQVPKFKKVSELPDKDVQALHETFTKNPTPENLHYLQSQIGSEIRALKPTKGKPDAATRSLIKQYEEAQAELKDVLHKHLSKSSPKAAELYFKAAEHYKRRALPYDLMEQQLAKIPEYEMRPTSIKTALRTVHRLAPREKNQLGFNRPIVPQELKKQVHSLTTKEAAKIAALAGAGLGGAHMLGAPHGMEAAADLLGAGMAPLIGKGIGPLFSRAGVAAPSSESLARALMASLIGEATL